MPSFESLCATAAPGARAELRGQPRASRFDPPGVELAEPRDERVVILAAKAAEREPLLRNPLDPEPQEVARERIREPSARDDALGARGPMRELVQAVRVAGVEPGTKGSPFGERLARSIRLAKTLLERLERHLSPRRVEEPGVVRSKDFEESRDLLRHARERGHGARRERAELGARRVRERPLGRRT